MPWARPTARIVLVTRNALEESVARYNTVEQAKFQAEHLGMDFSDFLEEDRRYQKAVANVAEALQKYGRMQRLERGFLPNFLFPPECLVVVVGQDGLVANTLKYLDGQSILGINPDPQRWQGVLLPFQVGDVGTLLPEVLRGQRKTREITLAQARLSDGQTLLAVNDLFIGLRGHASARYEIALGDRHERTVFERRHRRNRTGLHRLAEEHPDRGQYARGGAPATGPATSARTRHVVGHRSAYVLRARAVSQPVDRSRPCVWGSRSQRAATNPIANAGRWSDLQRRNGNRRSGFPFRSGGDNHRCFEQRVSAVLNQDLLPLRVQA